MEKTLEQLIRDVLKDKKISLTELGKRLSIKKRQGVTSLLKRKKMDVEMLSIISKELDYNFFQHYYNVNGKYDKKVTANTDNEGKPLKAKVVIEMELNADDILKLNLKNRLGDL